MTRPKPSNAEYLATLPSLQPFVQQLRGFLVSPAPPPALLIHAPANAPLALELVEHILSERDPSQSTKDDLPTIERLLPKYAVVDLTETHSTRAAFDRILNRLSGWDEAGAATWDEASGGVINWDGRKEGLSVVPRLSTNQVESSKRKREMNSAGNEKARKRARLESSINRASVSPDRENEDPATTSNDVNDAFEWELSWDRSIRATKDEIGLIPDTIEYFFTSLKQIIALKNNPDQRAEKISERGFDSDNDDIELDSVHAGPKPRFLIFSHGEMLSELPSAGTVGGAPRETGIGMTFVNAIQRVGELSHCQISSIIISQFGQVKSREALVGQIDPIVINFPDFTADAINLLTHRFAATRPVSRTLNFTDTVELFGSLVAVVFDIFSKARTDLDLLAYAVAKFWPKWLECVEKSNPPIQPTNTAALLSHLKLDFSRESDLLGSPRASLSAPNSPSKSPSRSHSVTGISRTEENVLHGFLGSMPALPSGPNFLASPPASPQKSAAAATEIDPFADPAALQRGHGAESSMPWTPLRQQALQVTSFATSGSSVPAVLSSRQQADQTLSKTLPTIAKFLLIAAFYASFNPVNSDVRHFVKIDETIAKKGKKTRRLKKKFGTPTSKSIQGAANSEGKGGKPFPLERLIAIFEAIVDDRIDFMHQSVNVQMEIQTLISLKLLQKASGADKLLDGVKLKSRLTIDSVGTLARSVGMNDWKQFLYDPEA